MFYFISLIDLASIIVTGSSVVAGLIIGGPDIKQGLLTARDCCIPMGVVGTLIGCVAMLNDLSDPSTLRPAMAIALLPLIYGVLLYPLLYSFSTRLPTKKSIGPTVTIIKLLFATMLIAVVLILAMLYCGSLLMFLDISSMLCVFLFLVIPSIAHQSKEQGSSLFEKCLVSQQYSVITSVVGVLIATALIITNASDPSAIGPAMAIGFLTPLYSGIGLIFSRLSYRALTGKEDSNALFHTTIYSMVSIGFTGFSFAVMMYYL